MPKIPDQCLLCSNLNAEEGLCKVYEFLPGEYGRESVKECPSFYEKNQDEELKILAQYIDEDKDHLIESSLTNVVNRILEGYEEKFKIMVVGIARRKIKAMIKMVDIIDVVLEKLSESSTIDVMSSGQMIRLLSELNYSINNDLTFIMKLVNPDSTLKDLQLWIDARSVVNVNGASKETEMKTEEILSLTNVSRDKIRDAFESILHNINVEGVDDEYIATPEEMENVQDL